MTDYENVSKNKDNKQSENNNFLKKIKLSFKTVKGMLLGFYFIIVLFVIIIIVHFFELDTQKLIVRDYHMNLSETVILDNIYSEDDVDWEVNSDNVVIENNVIRAINSGETYVIGKVSDKKVVDLRISVLSGEEVLILKEHSINLVVDESKTLKVNRKKVTRDSDLLEGIENLTFESSNELVVTVDKNGKIKAKKEGTAVITVIDEDGEQDHAYVTVSADDIYTFNNEYRLEVGDTSKIEYELNSIKYKHEDIQWKSSNNKVVKVGKNGKVLAIGEGEAYITFKINKDISKKVKVVVYKEVILPTNLQVSSNDIKLAVGESLKLNTTIEPLNATNKEVTYSSSNPSIVTVSSDGNVVGKANGSAIISVVTVNGIKKDIPVVISDKIISVTDILIYESTLNLLVGDTKKIEYKILPESATDKTVKFSVNGDCISIDTLGNIKALKAGIAYVTVTSSNGYSSVLTVQVTEKIDNSSISSVKINEGDINLSVGTEKQLTTTIFPENVKINHQQWTSSNPSVATVDKNGKVKALANGQTIITYQVNDYQCTIKIEVTTPKIVVKKVELNKEKIELKVGKSENLLVEVTPNNATNSTVTWISSNPSVATVDAKGKVVAINKGTTTITVISNDNSEMIDTCIVSVTYNVLINLENDSYNLIEGNSINIHASVSPSNASQELSFSSNNTDVAVVDNNGKVTAKSPGTAYIEIISKEDENIKVNCKIVVIAKTAVSGIKINESDVQLSFNNTYQLSTTITPSNATNKDIKWISSDEELAEVDNNGLIKVKQKTGKVTITAKSIDNSSVVDSINLWIIKENSKIKIEKFEKLEKYKEIMTYNFDSNDAIEKSYRAIQSFAIRNFGKTNEEVIYLMTKVNNPATINELNDAKTSIIFTVGSGSSNMGNVSYSVFKNGGHGQTLEFVENNLWVTCDGKFVSNGNRIHHQSHCLIPYANDSSIQSSKKKISYITTENGFSLYQEGKTEVTNPDLAIDTVNNLAAVVDQYKYLYIFKWDELQKNCIDAKYLIRKKLSVRNVQSLTIHNGYVYALDSPSKDSNGVSYPIRVHRYDLFGDVVTSIDLWTDPIKTSSIKQEGEGIKIYNNNIYLAVFQAGYNFSIYKMS